MKAPVRHDTHVSSTVLETEPRPKFTISQLVTTFTVSLVSVIMGYSAAYTSPTQSSLEEDFGLTTNQMSWISSFMPLGALVGGLCGGTLIEHLGRKWTILLTNLLFLCAWVINYFARDRFYLYSNRIIIGVASGTASLTLPVYLAESLQPEVRGTLGLIPASFGNMGILICFTFGMFYQWKKLALVGAILCIPPLLLIWWIPETPRFLISRGKDEEARKALRWLHGPLSNSNKEFLELQLNQRRPNDKDTKPIPLSFKNVVKLMWVILGLMFFQQMSGINAVIYYTTNIFKDSGSSLHESVCTTIVGAVNLVSVFIAVGLIDRCGRKVLLALSSVSMTISLGTLGAYFYLRNTTSIDLQHYRWLPLGSLMVYILGFSLGFGPVPWLMMGEILPSKIRGRAASVTTAFSSGCCFAVTRTFLLIVDAIGNHYTFWMYGCVTFIALVFTILFVPETKGQSLDDIEAKLAGVKVRAVSSVANMRPTHSMS